MNLKLPPVSPTGPQEALARQTREDGSGSGGGIGQNFEKLLQQVNQQQLTAEAKQVELARRAGTRVAQLRISVGIVG